MLKTERLVSTSDKTHVFNDLLCVHDGKKVHIGAPLVQGASVKAEVLAHDRHDKVIVFKKKRRNNYRRFNGHRQQRTVLRIKEICLSKEKSA